MPDRNLDFSPTVTNVTPELPDQGLMLGAADLADKVAVMSANAKALNATAQTSLAFRQLDVNYREATASDPNNPKALADLQTARSVVASKIGAQVPAIASTEYNSKVIALGESSDKLNEFWGMHQQMRNADSDLQTAETTNLKMANMAGKQFAADGANMGNLNSVLNFESAQDDIRKFATPVIGAPKTEAYLKDFNANWVKSFVAGVAGTNPQVAALMLKQPQIAEHFTTQDIGDMADVIKRTQRQNDIVKNIEVTKNDGSLADVVNDPNSDYLAKRATIDKMDAAGTVSSKAASAARRVIKSSEDLDSQTDTPFMANIVNKAYDLNANASTNSDDYLRGVQNLHQEILDGQADGRVTGRDASKITRQINDLSSKKLADATNTAGMEFYDANQKFNALPPEYRGQATRALFYAGDGKNWTPAQYGNQADQVIDQINAQRRSSAQKTLVGLPQNDDEFLKTIPNATPQSIQATATKYGISTKQVIQQLRAGAANAARAKKNGVSRIAPASAGEDDDKEEYIQMPQKPHSDLAPTENIDDMEEAGLTR